MGFFGCEILLLEVNGVVNHLRCCTEGNFPRHLLQVQANQKPQINRQIQTKDRAGGETFKKNGALIYTEHQLNDVYISCEKIQTYRFQDASMQLVDGIGNGKHQPTATNSEVSCPNVALPLEARTMPVQ